MGRSMALAETAALDSLACGPYSFTMPWLAVVTLADFDSVPLAGVTTWTHTA